MKQNKTRGYVILAILLVVFTAISFLPPFTKAGRFFVAYLFGVIAILSQVYFFKSSFSPDGDVKSKFYGFPIARIGVVFMVAQLIVSLVEMALALVCPTWLALLVNIIILAVALVGSIAAETMRDEIERQDVSLKEEVSAMRELQSLANGILAQCDSSESKAEIKRLADELRYSDPVSSDGTKELEAEILQQLRDVQKAVVDADAEAVRALTGKVMVNLAERNRLCRLEKGA